jgi:hypothetical protein
MIKDNELEQKNLFEIFPTIRFENKEEFIDLKGYNINNNNYKDYFLDFLTLREPQPFLS